MDLLDRRVMDLGFGGAQRLKDSNGPRLRGGIDLSPVDDLADLLQSAMLMLVGMRVLRLVNMRVLLARMMVVTLCVPMLVFMAMLMRVFMLMTGLLSPEF